MPHRPLRLSRGEGPAGVGAGLDRLGERRVLLIEIAGFLLAEQRKPGAAAASETNSGKRRLPRCVT